MMNHHVIVAQAEAPEWLADLAEPGSCQTTTVTPAHTRSPSAPPAALPEQGGVKRAQREPSPARVSPTLAHVALPAAGRTVFPTTRGPPHGVSWAIRWAATVTPR